LIDGRNSSLQKTVHNRWLVTLDEGIGIIEMLMMLQ